jgi:hypothetical protein
MDLASIALVLLVLSSFALGKREWQLSTHCGHSATIIAR